MSSYASNLPSATAVPAALPIPDPVGAPISPLPAGKRPNFIIILTDDQGYDDIGLHQPQKPGGKPTWVNTPNIDKFMQHATEFDNFYVTPMCSQSRAALLTGRDYARTGTMLINGGELCLWFGVWTRGCLTKQEPSRGY